MGWVVAAYALLAVVALGLVFRLGYIVGEHHGRMEQIRRFKEYRRIVETLGEG